MHENSVWIKLFYIMHMKSFAWLAFLPENAQKFSINIIWLLISRETKTVEESRTLHVSLVRCPELLSCSVLHLVYYLNTELSLPRLLKCHTVHRDAGFERSLGNSATLIAARSRESVSFAASESVHSASFLYFLSAYRRSLPVSFPREPRTLEFHSHKYLKFAVRLLIARLINPCTAYRGRGTDNNRVRWFHDIQLGAAIRHPKGTLWVHTMILVVRVHIIYKYTGWVTWMLELQVFLLRSMVRKKRFRRKIFVTDPLCILLFLLRIFVTSRANRMTEILAMLMVA